MKHDGRERPTSLLTACHHPSASLQLSPCCLFTPAVSPQRSASWPAALTVTEGMITAAAVAATWKKQEQHIPQVSTRVCTLPVRCIAAILPDLSHISQTTWKPLIILEQGWATEGNTDLHPVSEEPQIKLCIIGSFVVLAQHASWLYHAVVLTFTIRGRLALFGEHVANFGSRFLDGRMLCKLILPGSEVGTFSSLSCRDKFAVQLACLVEKW